MPVTQHTLDFLKQLAANNSKEWFSNHRSDYEKSLEEVKEFHSEVRLLMESNDRIENGRVYRIYRDVRFSKDKTPFKSHWAGSYKRATSALRGGYYFQIEPGNSYIAGGFFGPNSQDLLHIRNQISQYPDPLAEIVRSDEFVAYFGKLRGDKVKTAPKGFLKDDPAIDFIRHKQFLVEHRFSDSEVLSGEFAILVDEGFRNMRPFFEYMSEILTTDLNGESLID